MCMGLILTPVQAPEQAERYCRCRDNTGIWASENALVNTHPFRLSFQLSETSSQPEHDQIPC